MQLQTTRSCLRFSAAILFVALMVCRCWSDEQADVWSFRSDVPLNKQLHRGYFLNDGLPSNWINDVVQTRDGYVWIATDNGLVRYDGVDFNVFSPTIAPQLPSGEIRVLYESRDGNLWIGTSEGLSRYHPGRPGRFEAVSAVPDSTVRAIYEAGNGTLWIGTLGETYARLRGRDFEAVKDAPTNVRAVCEDQSGTIWIGSNSGLFRRQGESYEQITHERLPARTSAGSGIQQTRVNVILADEDGDLWIGTNRTLLHWSDGQFTSRGEELEAQQVYDILRTSDGGLYVAARFGIFLSENDGPLKEVSNEESAFSVMEDRERGLWVAHGDNRGLHHFRNNPAQEIWTKTRVRCIFDDSEHGLLFGANDGLHRLQDGVVTDYGVADGLPDRRVQSITQSVGNTLWIGTARGFVKWSGTSVVAADTPAPLSDMNIGSALEDSRGDLWFSLSSAGGYRLKDGVLSELEELRDRRIQWFWEGPGGDIWIGHESGLFQYRSGKIQRINDEAIERLKSPRFLCHLVSPDGTVWMGTSNGLLRYQSGKFDAFPPESGLLADNIERLTADNEGNLWFGGRDGLFHASIAEFDDYANGRLAKLTAYRVDGFDRFPPLIAFSQGCLFRDGEIWIADEHGLTAIPVQPFHRKHAPPIVHIDHAMVDDRPANFEQRFEYLAGRRRLTVQFSAPAFVNPKHIQFRYRLEGHDDQWVDAGGDRNAQYTDLRPGDYVFRIAARHANEDWANVDAPMRFSVLPRWWEWVWLRVTVVLLAILAGLGFVQYRIRSYRRANSALRREINERQRAEQESRSHQEQLARVSRAASMGELTTSIAHEVKQPLFAIVSNAQTARRLLDRDKPDVDEVREALSDIADDGNRASGIIDRVRALVKKEHLVKHRLDLNEVARDAVAFAEPEIVRLGFVIDTDFASNVPPIKGDPIELQQVILNLLINAAQAMSDADPESRLVTLRTSASDNSVELSVQDQGVGLKTATSDKLFEPFFTTKPQGTGMGLAINRTIIEAHGGRIWATQNENRGLTFHFSLPARTASRNSESQNLRQEVS